MGIYDRDYNRPDHYQQQYHVRLALPPITPVVKWLLIINVAVYLISVLIRPVGEIIYTYGSVYPANLGYILQIWRFITYQFLHNLGSPFHLFFNMLILYFFGPILEQQWGSRGFLRFYLASGAAGGIVYTLLVLFGILGPLPMVGASGALYGIMVAVAIMYPGMRVYVFGIFPMTILTLVIVSAIISLLKFAGGSNAGGEAAHLTGMVVGFLYVKFKPWITHSRMERQKGAWARKLEQEQAFQKDVDRILDKVNREGIQSLSRHEKQTLQEATRREQESRRK